MGAVKTKGSIGSSHIYIFWRKSVDWLTNIVVNYIFDCVVDGIMLLYGWPAKDPWDEGR